MIADYYFIRKQELVLTDLYNPTGIYSFTNGINRGAIVALFAGILPNVPGFLTTIKVVDTTFFPAWLNGLYSYAWFVGFGISALVYILLFKKKN